MIFVGIICIIGLIVSSFMIIKPLKMMNAIRSMFILRELDADTDDFQVFVYRVKGIAGILIFSLFLLRILTM